MAALNTKFNIEPVQLKEKDLINLGVCWSVYISLLLEDFYSHFLITGRFYSQGLRDQSQWSSDPLCGY